MGVRGINIHNGEGGVIQFANKYEIAAIFILYARDELERDGAFDS